MFRMISSNTQSIWEIWEHHARTIPNDEAIIHWRAESEPIRITYSQLINSAYKYSKLLIANGIKRNEVCAIILKHNPEFYAIYLSVVKIGAIPAVLAYPNPRLHPEKFIKGIEGMSQRSGLDWILTDPIIGEIIQPFISHSGSTIKGTFYPIEQINKIDLTETDNPTEPVFIKKEDALLLQHSSGTTGLQKPVLLSHNSVITHLNTYAKVLNLNPNDKVVSWLPLYHDMGLIAAFHLPLAYGIPTIQIDPFEWVLAPLVLLEAITKECATLTWLPNFAYNLMADKIPDDYLKDIKLNSLRMVINCSEPVRNESHEKFIKKFGPLGLERNALSTCYAMAETTFAVTQTLPGEPVEVLKLNKNKFSQNILEFEENRNDSRICVSSGRVIQGCQVLIVDDKRNIIPQGAIGEIVIQSDSMFDGYRNYPEKTNEVLVDGWYYSGDYGFLFNSNLYVIGRKKDIKIVAGKNIYPEDIEDNVSAVPGVIPGRVVAFGEYDQNLGTECISVIAETKSLDESEKKKLKIEILKNTLATEITINHLFLVPPRWLIKSSAGKPSRKANMERISNQEEKIKWSVK